EVFSHGVSLKCGFSVRCVKDPDFSPDSPQNLTTSPGNQHITLHWDQNTESDLVKYRIYRDTTSPATTLIDSVVGSPPDTFYIDEGLTNGQVYYYRITAVAASGNESDFSNEVYAVPGDYIAPVIQILNPGEGFSIPEYEPLTVTWTATDNIAMDSVLIIYTNEPGVDLQFMGKVPADSSQFTFIVPAGVTDNAIIYLHGWDTSGNDTLVHSPYFSVTDNTPPEYVEIEAIGQCSIGKTKILSWEAEDNTGFRSHHLYLSSDDGAFAWIDSVSGADFQYNWLVPNVMSDRCRIMVKSVDLVGLSAADTSEYFSIVDGIPPEIEVLSPTEGFSIPEYELLTTTWNATDNIAMDSIRIIYTTGVGQKVHVMGTVPSDSSQFSFNIPQGVTDNAMVILHGWDTAGNDTIVYSPRFSVTDNTPPEVDLLTQFSDSSFEIMSTRSIFWAATDNVAIQLIDIVYSIDAGDNWISISENEPNDGEYSWLIPNTPSEQCKIKVTATDSVELSDEAISDGLFTIYVTYPKLISHSTIISALDTIQLGFSQTLNIEQFNTGLALSSAIEENLTYDFQFLNNNQYVSIYPENSFVSGDTISLILSADQITNAYGYGLDGNQNNTFEGSPVDNDTVTVYVNYSGDFDSNDQVDFNDLTLFAKGWYSKNYKYELGPVTGDIPHFITMTDSLFNIEDAMTFGRMWNWFVGLGKHAITMPQLSFGGGFTTEQKGNDLIIHSRASAGKRIVLQYDPEIITINREQRSLTKPTDLTFEFYADCIDSNRSEYVHYSFNEEISNVPVIFTLKSKQRDPVNITIGVEGIDETGELILSDVITTRFQPIPDKFEVFPNYPNPFNSQTVIEYAIPVQSDVFINIYDLLGRKVRTLTNNRHEAKYYTLIWDGKDDQGRLAASGLYFLRIVARNENTTFIKTKKMVMLR
ncbi:T9SS type A sorting domain-containing protein, partial [bacterium]|nr:T9SS type A sorting domain-containing protein [bacterium]